MSFDSSKVVLIGVRVTAALIAAITQIMDREGLIAGKKTAMALPRQAPIKNKGIINPPGQPPVTVTPMAAILPKAKPNNKTPEKLVVTMSAN